MNRFYNKQMLGQAMSLTNSLWKEIEYIDKSIMPMGCVHSQMSL